MITCFEMLQQEPARDPNWQFVLTSSSINYELITHSALQPVR